MNNEIEIALFIVSQKGHKYILLCVIISNIL